MSSLFVFFLSGVACFAVPSSPGVNLVEQRVNVDSGTRKASFPGTSITHGAVKKKVSSPRRVFTSL